VRCPRSPAGNNVKKGCICILLRRYLKDRPIWNNLRGEHSMCTKCPGRKHKDVYEGEREGLKDSVTGMETLTS